MQPILGDPHNTIVVLPLQVGTYKEDFESERRDRERANEKIQQQKEELDNLNQIVAMLVSCTCLVSGGKMLKSWSQKLIVKSYDSLFKGAPPQCHRIAS